MSLGISQTIGSAMPIASAACFIGAGAFAGRKVICGIVCKAGAKAAELMGKENAAEWKQASSDYFTQAKIDAPRDFAAATGLVLCGLLAKHAGETFKETSPKPEPTKYEKYIAPVVGFVGDYKKPLFIGVTTLAIFAGIKKFYNKQTPLQQTVIQNTVPKNSFKIIKKEAVVKEVKNLVETISQESFNKAFDAEDSIKKLGDETIKKIATLNTNLPSDKTISSKYGLGPSFYGVNIPSIEEMRASFQSIAST